MVYYRISFMFPSCTLAAFRRAPLPNHAPVSGWAYNTFTWSVSSAVSFRLYDALRPLSRSKRQPEELEGEACSL